MPTWLLPEAISDVLPTEARKIEALRRGLLDLYRSYGYELVFPPLLEYLDSLLSGTAQDLDLRTFKLIDQISGRTMGLRADITPQVARIDAHLLNRQGITRLCYAGNVLHTRPVGLLATREPFQVGAEIYGCSGIEADLEIIELILASLKQAGIHQIRLDLNHIGIVAAILNSDKRAAEKRNEILQALQSKSTAELIKLSEDFAPPTAAILLELLQCYGSFKDTSAVTHVSNCLRVQSKAHIAWQQLMQLAQSTILKNYPECELTFDLTDIRGFDYHSGILFAAYCDGLSNAVTRGGRYDDVGEVFGRARPATGFSLELRELVRLMPEQSSQLAIIAPAIDDGELRNKIATLRQEGEIVVQILPGHEQNQQELQYDRQLVKRNNQWLVEKI